MKYLVFTAIWAVGSVLVLIFNSDTTAVFVLSLVFVVSNIAITFEPVNIAQEQNRTPSETPVKYYERQSSFNLENYSRSAILVISGILFVYSGTLWWLVLIVLWAISELTVAIPIYNAFRGESLSLLETTLVREFSKDASREEVLLAIDYLDQLVPESDQPLSNKNLFADPKLADRFIQKYRIMKKRLGE